MVIVAKGVAIEISVKANLSCPEKSLHFKSVKDAK